MKLILGSSSQPRQQALKDMGYEFEIIKPEIDEQSIRDQDPRQLVLKLAHAKADDVIKRVKGGAIIITDTRTRERKEGAAEASVVFNPIPKDKVKDFVESGAVFNHAGAYAIQKEPFASHIKEVRGEVETIIGLPKSLTQEFLTLIDL